MLRSISELIEMKDNQGLIIAGIAEMLDGIMEMLDFDKLYGTDLIVKVCEIACKHLRINLPFFVRASSE